MLDAFFEVHIPVIEKSFYTFEDIDLGELHVKLHKKTELNSGS